MCVCVVHISAVFNFKSISDLCSTNSWLKMSHDILHIVVTVLSYNTYVYHMSCENKTHTKQTHQRERKKKNSFHK